MRWMRSGELGSGLLEGCVGEGLIGTGDDAVVGDAGVGDGHALALLHVAADAVVGVGSARRWLHARLHWCFATLRCMAGEALAVEVRGRFGGGGLDVGIVAGDAAHLFVGRIVQRGAIALAHGHGVVVLDMIFARRIIARGRDHEDGHDAIQRRAGAKIQIGFAGLEDARIAGLMAGHADVIGQGRREVRGVDDGGVFAFGPGLAIAHGLHVR